MTCRQFNHLSRHVTRTVSFRAAMRFSPTFAHDCSLSGRAGQAGKLDLSPVSLDDHRPALCASMSGSLARATNDLFVSTTIELPKPQVLVGKADHQESKQCAFHRRRARDHLTITVWTFHVDSPQLSSLTVTCLVRQIKQAGLSVTRLQYSFDAVMEALGETIEPLCVLACGFAIGEQAELARMPGLDVKVVQIRQNLPIDL
jgi:hypothetical protein